jgi:hypothetical protein
MLGFWSRKNLSIEAIFPANKDPLPKLVQEIETVLVAKDRRVDGFSVVESRFFPSESKRRISQDEGKSKPDPPREGIDLLNISGENIVGSVLPAPVFVDFDAVPHFLSVRFEEIAGARSGIEYWDISERDRGDPIGHSLWCKELLESLFRGESGSREDRFRGG